MGQINERLRSIVGQHFSHWCPGCEMMHGVPLTWKWDGNIDAPTVHPSLLINGHGEGKAVGGMEGGVCHYFIKGGFIQFQGDCTHPYNGRTAPLPPLPPFHRDDFKG